MRVMLGRNKAYPWVCENMSYFRGFFIVKEHLYRDREALEYIDSAIIHSDDLTVKLNELNGCFSIIFQKENQIFIVSDKLRSLPLFYTIFDGEIVISDDAKKVCAQINLPQLDEGTVGEYLASSLYVLGDKTLVKNLYQIQAAELLVYDERKQEKKSCIYYNHMSDFTMPKKEMDGYREDFIKCYDRVVEHMIMALNGRTAVVPLSGGSDSRMIVSLLRKYNYEKVICFTYGKHGNEEAKISKMVAEEYGYQWIYIPYTKEKWRQLRNSKILNDYYCYAANYVSTPHIQDFLAVMEMKQRNLIPDDSVFIPGHSGDVPAGSWIKPEDVEGETNPQESIETCLSYFAQGDIEQIKATILRYYPIKENQQDTYYTLYKEWYNISERQAKYIVNSVRIYEYFGYEWLIPLWDNSIFEFWRKIPVEYRFNRRLYFDVVGRKIPSTNDDTMSKRIADRIRAIRGINTFVRVIFRLKKYYSSTLCFEQLYSLGEYFKMVMYYQDFFSVMNCFSHRYVDRLKQEMEYK